MLDNIIALPTQATTVQELMPTLRLLIERIAQLELEIAELKNEP